MMRGRSSAWLQTENENQRCRWGNEAREGSVVQGPWPRWSACGGVSLSITLFMSKWCSKRHHQKNHTHTHDYRKGYELRAQTSASGGNWLHVNLLNLCLGEMSLSGCGTSALLDLCSFRCASSHAPFGIVMGNEYQRLQHGWYGNNQVLTWLCCS